MRCAETYGTPDRTIRPIVLKSRVRETPDVYGTADLIVRLVVLNNTLRNTLLIPQKDQTYGNANLTFQPIA